MDKRIEILVSRDTERATDALTQKFEAGRLSLDQLCTEIYLLGVDDAMKHMEALKN